MKNTTKRLELIIFMTLVMQLSACSDNESPTTSEQKPEISETSTTPNIVSFNKTALYPEGLEYDQHSNSFLVTSIREGIVGRVSNDGNYTVFAQDQRMVSAVGIRIDSERNRVLVCNADPGASQFSTPETTGKLAALMVFELSTGKAIKYIDLAEGIEGSHFCNDIAIDHDGTAYITDSFSTIIYKVTADYKTSVLINNQRFAGSAFNLNGIVIKDNYLLVNKFNEGTLFKIPLDKPENFSQVKINEKFDGADGLLWAPDGSLILIANDSGHGGFVPGKSTNKVIKLSSTDNWATAEVISTADTGDVFATTGVVRDGQIYVVYAMLHILFNPKTEQHIKQFEIRKQVL